MDSVDLVFVRFFIVFNIYLAVASSLRQLFFYQGCLTPSCAFITRIMIVRSPNRLLDYTFETEKHASLAFNLV